MNEEAKEVLRDMKVQVDKLGEIISQTSSDTIR